MAGQLPSLRLIFSIVSVLVFAACTVELENEQNYRSLQNEIQELRTEMANQKHQIDSLSSSCGCPMTHGAVDQVNASVEEIKNDLISMKTKLRQVNNDTDSMKYDMVAIKSEFQDISNRLSHLNDTMNTFSENVLSAAYTPWSEWTECTDSDKVKTRSRSCIFGVEGDLLCTELLSNSRGCCPRKYYDLQDFGFKSCIMFYQWERTHEAAARRCAVTTGTMNGHLIEITSLEKKKIVQDYVFGQKNLNIHHYIHVDGELRNGSWVNRNGVPLDYLPWGSQPYLKSGWIYLAIHPEDFLLYDIQNQYLRQYICEVDV